MIQYSKSSQGEQSLVGTWYSMFLWLLTCIKFKNTPFFPHPHLPDFKIFVKDIFLLSICFTFALKIIFDRYSRKGHFQTQSPALETEITHQCTNHQHIYIHRKRCPLNPKLKLLTQQTERTWHLPSLSLVLISILFCLFLVLIHNLRNTSGGSWCLENLFCPCGCPILLILWVNAGTRSIEVIVTMLKTNASLVHSFELLLMQHLMLKWAELVT